MNSALRLTLSLLDPLSDIERTVFELDAIRLAAVEKFHSIVIDERHIPQIQNQLLPGSFHSEQLSQFLDIFCFNSATKLENDPAIR
jgi:hypothetical protein